MKRWLTSLVLPAALIACQSSTTSRNALVAYEQDGKYGFRDLQGSVVIPAQFLSATAFSPEGVAFAVNEKGWICINEKAAVLLSPYVYDNGPDNVSEGLFRYVQEQKIGFADRACKVTIPAAYDFAAPFSERLAAVCNGCQAVKSGGEHSAITGGAWGYIDRNGAVVIPIQYNAAESFVGGKATVVKGGQAMSIDPTGRPLP